ncbi:hypothetical protein D2Q93_03145 [Alicyclobacillaceae bacterium I2511]|nr:hypothetical protein D2Q93_03145 [Alicyclobacillaceae bacterium I2511]
MVMQDMFRKEVLRIQAEIVRRLEDTDGYGLNDSMRDSLGELSLADNHPADIGDELFEREKDLGLRQMDELQLKATQHALRALDAGTYGTCEVCKTPIPVSRLKANPLATQCVQCKQESERTHIDLPRPVEEEFLDPPFSRTLPEEKESVEFDREDAWQAVDRYNQRQGIDE